MMLMILIFLRLIISWQEFTSNRQDWADFGRFMQNSIIEVIQYLWDKDASQRRHTVKTLDQFLKSVFTTHIADTINDH